MKILIDFEDEAIWEAADDNQITLNLLEKRLTKFCNSTTVTRIILEGVILDPLLSKKELN